MSLTTSQRPGTTPGALPAYDSPASISPSDCSASEPSTGESTTTRVLTPDQWQQAAEQHADRVRDQLGEVLDRRRAGVAHPVEDFMFDYYRVRPAQLFAWHPGVGIALDGAAGRYLDGGDQHPSDRTRRWYRADAAGRVCVDAARFWNDRGSTMEFTRRLLEQTRDRTARFDCFGLHEWAMVYRPPRGVVRHTQVPLRFEIEQVAEIVDAHELRCRHFDAFRFFTPEASGRNAHQLTRADQVAMDQPGCLHVNMDLFKFAQAMVPLVSSAVLLDCFDLARRIRHVDMRASAYDLRAWGFEPIRIETAAGKTQYVELQRGFAAEAQVLRGRLLAVLDAS